MDDDVDSIEENPTVELIVSDFGEPAGEPHSHHKHKKNSEEST